MGGGKGGSSHPVYDFLLSMDYGVCHGPLKYINRIRIKDKDAFAGRIEEDCTVILDRRNLFGGDDAEGGIFGTAEFYMGSEDQIMSENLAARFGLLPKSAPGYRGTAHVFFRGETTIPEGSSEKTDGWGNLLFFNAGAFILSKIIQSARDTMYSGYFGFMWGSNNPYLPPAEIAVTGEPVGLTETMIYPITGVDINGDYTIAGVDDAWTTGETFDPTKAPDANPAAMIYEAFTNAAFGKGDPETAMDKASFEACATTLKTEHFGLSMMWSRQSDIETYIGEILDHIKGMVFQDPETGLWTMKLIRDDYDLGESLVLNEDNCDVESIEKRVWGETINEVKVSYTDPVSEEGETVSAQNLANIAIQGGVLSDSRDYHGIRNPWLAQQVADRDVLEASRPITTAAVYVNRSGYVIKPGDVVVFNWEEEEIVALPMRVMSVDYGTKKDRRIKLSLTEDIFSVRETPTIDSQVPPVDPDELPSTPDQVMLMTPPLSPMLEFGYDADEIDANYPESHTLFFAHDDVTDFIDVQADSDIVLPNGSNDVGPISTFTPVRSGILQVGLAPEVRSVIPETSFRLIIRRDGVVGDRFVIGSSEAVHEIIMLDSYNDTTEEWTVLRGLYDTQPRTWLSSDRLWLLPTSASHLDQRDLVAGTPVSYWLRPRTSLGRLSLASAAEEVFTPSERLHQPYRPANCQIAGNGFSDTSYLAGTVPATIDLTWATRNRLGEDAVAQAWNDPSVALEAGSSVTLRFVDQINGVVDFEVPGLTGSSYTLDTNDVPTYRFYDVHFVTERDGLESRQPVVRALEIERLGYGSNYGYDYGENNGDGV